MTRLLIVDDDPRQLRLLSLLFAKADPNLSLDTSSRAEEAIERLETESFDVVLTDIQMPGMDGLELVAWLLSHQPEMPVFTMTAYPDADALRRLEELGAVECFTKPLDVESVLGKLSAALEDGVHGHIRNFSLISFLQLVTMERKTCTLHVVSNGRKGELYFDNGQLIEARTGELSGDDAAINIVAWGSPAITINSACLVRTPTIQSSTSFILMEAMRVQDEASQTSMDSMERFEEDEQNEVQLEVEEEARPLRRSSNFPARQDENVDLLALVHLETKEIKVLWGEAELTALAQLGSQIYVTKRDMVRQLDSSETIREVVVTTGTYGILVRPLSHNVERVVVLVFDRARANLAMQRGELDSFVGDLGAWVSKA